MTTVSLAIMFGVCTWLCFHSDLFDPVEAAFEKAANVARIIVALSLAISFILFWIDVLFFPALAH